MDDGCINHYGAIHLRVSETAALTSSTLTSALGHNFLGRAPRWYKFAIIAFVIADPFILRLAGPVAAGWCVLFEFIFCLALALQCYPLQPGGLLALDAVLMGLTSPAAVYAETLRNFPVILLLIFSAVKPYALAYQRMQAEAP